MPATHFSFEQNQIYPQPDFSATQNDKGGWTASRTYKLRRETWNNSTFRAKFARGVGATVLDTTLEPYHAFLTIDTVDFLYEEANHVAVRVNFSGGSYSQYDTSGGSPAAEISYRVEGRLVDKPISEHPDFVDLGDQLKVALGRLINGEAQLVEDESSGWLIRFGEWGGTPDFPVTPQDTSLDGEPFALELALRINAGKTSYFSPTIAYIETRQGRDPIPSSRLQKLGKIDTPAGTPPDPGTGRDWMLTGASQEQRGDLYQTSLEWTASDDGGWDTFLYE